MKRKSGILFLVILVSINTVISRAQQKSNSSSELTTKQAGPGSAVVQGPDQENLGSFSIKNTRLLQIESMVGEKDDYPDFTRELIEVRWRAGDPIDLYVIKPRGVPKPPVVLYLYSYPSDTDRFRDNDYCRRITFKGYAAVGFVSALTGHRYHDRPMREWFVSQLPEALTKSVHDVQMVLRYLSERGDLDMDLVGIFGQGSGATIAILAATVTPQIRAVDALQPWGDWPTWLAHSSLIPESERPAYLKPEFLASVAPLDPVRRFGEVQTKDLHVQFVLDDTVTPADAVQHMKAAVPSSAKVAVYESKHQQHDALAGGRAFEWIKQQLRGSLAQPENAQGSGNLHRAQNERAQ